MNNFWIKSFVYILALLVILQLGLLFFFVDFKIKSNYSYYQTGN